MQNENDVQKNKIEIELPVIVASADYNDFQHMQNLFRMLNEKICVDEIGFAEGLYGGLIHDGSENHILLLNKLRTEIKKEE